MANSVVDTENPFGPSFASFDDASSTLSEREDFLLVLVSSLSGSTAQVRNQKRALTIIEACGVHPEVLDAADPANALVRDELCEMSGIRGVYPQFFLVQGDRTSFFADFAEVEHMNEEGTLAEWLLMELPIAKLSPKKPVNERKESTDVAANNNADRSRISRSNTTQVYVNTVKCSNEFDHEYASSSTTDDLLNVESVSKILDSFDANSSVPDKQLHHQQQNISGSKSEPDDGGKNMISSIPTTSIKQDEWSDPMLLERYEDEILALEDYLQESDEEDQGHYQHKRIAAGRRDENKGEIQSKKLEAKIPSDNLETGARFFKPQNLQYAHTSGRIADNYGNETKSRAKIARQTEHNFGEEKRNSVSSVSSTATTATISPTSSSSASRSPDRHRVHQKSAVDNIPSTLPSPPLSSFYKNKNGDKDISCIDTVSTRSETEQLLQAEVEELRLRCEKLTAERYIMEGQLKEARQRNEIEEEKRSPDTHSVGMVHKYQLQQTLRCSNCNKVFKSNPSSPNAPIASQSCGHSICRSCCHKRLSEARRHRDENTMNSSERLRNTMTSDLFMCGMGDMSHVYSPSFDEHQRQLQECESCPVCCAPRAFRPGRLNVNESLCIVLKLLEN